MNVLSERSVAFLCKYSWIYDFKVTNILSDGILANIPYEWRRFLSQLTIQDFNDIFFDSDIAYTSIPDHVSEFIKDLKSLYLPRKVVSLSQSSLSNSQKKKIGLKKEHEIVNFAAFIDKTCDLRGVTNVVDIGSGLGYLGEELSRKGYNLIGIEGSESHTKRADRRKETHESHNFKTINMVIDDSSDSLCELSSIVPENSCLVGLHCCGDLTPHLINIFAQLEKIQSLMIVSCCYHKMASTSKGFRNFPLSEKLKFLVSNSNNPDAFNGFMLRLGAQETVKRWISMEQKEHGSHMKSMGFRAILQEVAVSNNINLVKKKRRIKQSDFEHINSFLNCISKQYDIDEANAKILTEKVAESYQLNSKLFDLFELLTGLQFLVQSVIENLIHMDRVLYLNEKLKVSECDIVEVFDEVISPRNKVIFASR